MYVSVLFMQPFGLVWMRSNGRLIQLMLVRLVDIKHTHLVMIHVEWEASDPMRAFILWRFVECKIYLCSSGSCQSQHL